MTSRLGPKQLLMITYFLENNNKWATPKDIKTRFKKDISVKTITETLKYNDIDKREPFLLFNKTITKNGIVYRLISELNTFIILADNFLKSSYSPTFFESDYTRLLLKNNKDQLLKRIVSNLDLDVDKETYEKMWDVMIKSPRSLNYGLFGEKAESQIGFFEKLIIAILTDLKNEEFDFGLEHATEEDYIQLITVELKIIEHIGIYGKTKEKEFNLGYYPG